MTAASHFGSAMLSFSRAGNVAFAEALVPRRVAPRTGTLLADGSPATSRVHRLETRRALHASPRASLRPVLPSGYAHHPTSNHGSPLAQRRTYAKLSDERPYEAVVVGAGPAGITCVGNLLERHLAPILWVDDAFNGGRVNRMYREVPSNTKVKTFMDFALGVAPFRRIVSGVPQQSRWGEEDAAVVGGKEDLLQAMRSLDPEKGCRLGHAADMCLMLTEGLRETAGVTAQEGRVAEATFDEGAAHWSVRLQPGSASSSEARTVQAKRVVLCTGSSPNNDPLPVDIPNLQNLDLDTALSPTRLSSAISPLGPTTISVIGASHSAILVLMNLYGIASTSKPDLKVRWLTRHPLRYAVFMDGWILRDNTGLKGEAAEWAKANLEPDVYPQSDVSKYIQRIDYEAGREKDVFLEGIPGSDFYVQAIGYNRDPIPTIKTSGGGEVVPQFDHERGTFNYVKESADGKVQSIEPLPGLFGAGIAYPERVKDPHGNVEMSVGFWKFMRFVKRVSPEWNGTA